MSGSYICHIRTITQFPHNGIVGYGGTKASDTVLGGKPFFQTLCDQGVVDECRFGIAYGTSGSGKHILGGVDHSLFEGELSHTEPNLDFGPVFYNGSIVYKTASETKTIEDQVILLDSGTANVVGTLRTVEKIFRDLGIQAVNQTSAACQGVLYGYYPCDSPATVGFTVGSETFYIEPSAFKLADNGNNNCTATITAVAELADFDFWIVGQTWFQGKYVDFQQPKSIGAAVLKDKSHVT
jgi:hypothetical protein